MPSLKFNRLLLLSDTLRAGRQLTFGDRITLITADDNSVGKSTAVKCLFWAFGCEPFFDTTFKGIDAKVIVDFEVDNVKYRIRRYKDDFKIKKENEHYTTFTKVGEGFSDYLANILHFKARLPSRKADQVEVPPPVYYFIPYYIDQVKSWSEAWNNFEKLQQFANWKSTIIEYHVGILTDEYFEYSEKISETTTKLNLSRDIIKNLESAYSVIEQQRPKSVATISEEEFGIMTDEISDRLRILTQDQEILLNDLAVNQTDITTIESQIDITKTIIVELDQDYRFAVEHIVEDTFECPLCGVLHDNDVINRSSILTDKAQALAQLELLESDQMIYKNKTELLKNKIKDTRGKIKSINDKYVFKDENNYAVELTDVIEQIASNAIQSRIEKNRVLEIFNEKSLKDKIKELKIQQKETTTESRRDMITDSFNQIFGQFIDSLNAEGINLSKINKPTNYNQIVKEGGAAEGVRGILSYYLTIYKLINEYSNEVISPLVIDTPNQHEQSEKNYEKIVEALLDEDFKNGQIIICAMNHQNIKPLKDNALVIKLDENKLFLMSEYDKLYDEFKI